MTQQNKTKDNKRRRKNHTPLLHIYIYTQYKFRTRKLYFEAEDLIKSYLFMKQFR